MKQGPFARAGLCCPTAATATTAPSDSLWAAVHFPGPPVIGRRCFPDRRPGAQEGLSSSQDNLPTVPRPLRRGVLEHPPQEPGCRPWPSPSRHGLGSPLTHPRSPGRRDEYHDAAGFASCCGPVDRAPPRDDRRSTSTPASRPTPGAPLPRTLVSPRTGLTPAGCPELDARLHPNLPSIRMPGLLDVHPEYS